MILKAKKLKPGNTIGIVSPAGPILPDRLDRGLKYLIKQGYRVKVGEHLSDRNGYLAGTDEDRTKDLNRMFADDDIDAIFCARGGYGTPRILADVDYESIRKNPKIVVGYSDITALQLAIFAKTRLVTFSGPMVAAEIAGGLDPFTEYHLWGLLTEPKQKMRLTGRDGNLECIKAGKARGRLLGGCLSLICTLVGTPYLPDFSGAILFIEDVGEEPYRIDRKLAQLKLSGILTKISGLLLGRFENCEPASVSTSQTVRQILDDLSAGLDIPIATGLPYGHVATKYTIPIGVPALLDSDDGYLEILDSPLA